MTEQMHNSTQPARGWLALTLAIAIVVAPASLAFGSGKKKDTAEAPQQVNLLSTVDKARIVWPA